MIGNGDTAPRGLRNAYKLLTQQTRKLRKKIRSGFTKQPRQLCKVCGAAWDEALVAPNASAEVTICPECRKLLAEGYTALVTMNPDRYAFVRNSLLKETGAAGKIVQLTKEQFDAYERAFKTKQQSQDKGSQAGPAGEA